MTNKTKLYGAYGSNTNILQMEQRCPKAKLIGKGTLQEHKLTFRGMSRGVANIEACENRSVPIVIWEITEACEKALDFYEGYPNLYIKKEIEVIVGEELIKAMVYIMTDKYTNKIAIPTEHYFNTISKGYRDNNIDIKHLKMAYIETRMLLDKCNK